MSPMAATDLLAAVRAAGGDLVAAGDRLRVTAPEPLPAELMERLRAAKSELLAALAAPVGGVPFLITHAMRADLAALGHSADDIRGMTPAKAHEILTARPADTSAGADTSTGAEDERAASVAAGTGPPSAWADSFARLDATRPPGDVPPSRWRTFIDDAGRFLDGGWADRAAALGWMPLDLFGCDRRKPFARIDHAGLVWLHNGRKVLALTTDSATIENRDAPPHTYRRKPTLEDGQVVLAWELDP
jgi:hypothetical protein